MSFWPLPCVLKNGSLSVLALGFVLFDGVFFCNVGSTIGGTGTQRGTVVGEAGGTVGEDCG